jgi:phosphoglycerate dehydrogenase-like enzyme
MSSPIHILITLPLSESLVDELENISPRLKITPIRARKPEEIPPEVWEQTEILYTSRVLPAPEQAPNLRWIQFHWAGIDHAISAPILHKPDLVATTLSGAAASQVAEYVVMMFLTLGHRFLDMFAHQRRGEWPKDRWERFSPKELRDSTVGIIGYGSIGRQIARLLHPFGTRILAIKRDVMHPEDDDYTPSGWGDPHGDLVNRLYPPQALRSMLKECDFVVITLPLTSATENYVNAEALAALKPGAFLVDVSRGGILDQEALVAALKERKIGGAALDVFPEEPLPDDDPLWKLNNVILTPHISGITSQYDARAVELFSENLSRYLSGLPLYNRFDPESGY